MTATTKQVSLPVQVMPCLSCVSHAEGALTELEGMTGAVVNLGLAARGVPPRHYFQPGDQTLVTR